KGRSTRSAVVAGIVRSVAVQPPASERQGDFASDLLAILGSIDCIGLRSTRITFGSGLCGWANMDGGGGIIIMERGPFSVAEGAVLSTVARLAGGGVAGSGGARANAVRASRSSSPESNRIP